MTMIESSRRDDAYCSHTFDKSRKGFTTRTKRFFVTLLAILASLYLPLNLDSRYLPSILNLNDRTNAFEHPIIRLRQSDAGINDSLLNRRRIDANIDDPSIADIDNSSILQSQGSLLSIVAPDESIDSSANIMKASAITPSFIPSVLSSHGGSSDVQICRAILSHSPLEGLGNSVQQGGGLPSSSSSSSIKAAVSVKEDMTVCLDSNNPTASLGQIFSAAYLAQQASAHHGVEIKYDHRCGVGKKLGQLPSNIQQLLLPIHLESSTAVGEETENLSWQDLNNFCMSRMQEQDNQEVPGEHVLFSWIGQDQHQKSLLEYAVPFIQSSILSVIDTSKRTVITGTATIYLPCEDEFCTDMRVLPHYLYLMHIPSSVKSIHLIVQKGYMDNSPSISQWYMEDLVEVLQKRFPRAKISYSIEDPTSVIVFSMLIQSEYIICGPDKSSIWSGASACFFPAVARGREEDGEINPSVMIFQNSGPESEGKDGMMLRLGEIFYEQSPKFLSHVKLLPMPQFELFSHYEESNNFGRLSSFLKSPPLPASGDCMYVRGKIGTWIEDLQNAHSAQYSSNLRHYSGQSEIIFKRKASKGKTGGIKYRPSSTYRWVETHSVDLSEPQVPREPDGCEVELITLDNLCTLLQAMDIRKIFLVGDSLMLQQAQSLWMLLEQEDQLTEPGSSNPNFTKLVICPNHAEGNNEPFQFKYQFIRNDYLVESDNPVDIGKHIQNCGNSYCYPWFEAYKADQGIRNLIIANTGLHVTVADEFRKHFHDFVQNIDLFQQEKTSLQKNDIVMFRTSVPGHFGCEIPSLTPFSDYTEYTKFVKSNKQSILDKYGWNNVFEYNDEVAASLYKRRNMDWSSRRQVNPNPGKKALIEILDILPMTILRRDGHIGDEFKPDLVPVGDCLHYALPGPIDWWNHLLYSNIKDIHFQESSRR